MRGRANKRHDNSPRSRPTHRAPPKIHSEKLIAAAMPEPPMALTFFDQVGHDAPVHSLGASGTRLRVDFEVRPVRFADVETISALTGQHLTPVLSDGDHVVHETWDIACYLEERFPSNPSLFGGAIGRGMARLINVWSDTQLGSPLCRVIYGDFPAVLDAEDRAYLRATR